MLNKQKTEKIIDNIFKNTIAFTPTELEWFNEEYAKQHPKDDDLWCRFFTVALSPKELTQLLKHFDIYITSIDPEGIDKDSKLLHYYFQHRDDEEEPMILFQVQITEK